MSALLDEEVNEFYTRKTTHIQYDPNVEYTPDIHSIYNRSKFEDLCKKIESANLPDDVTQFLQMSATRFIEFNYARIADYYCSAPKQVQELMEDLGLVIIDYEDAYEKGFVELNDFCREIYDEAKNSEK